MCYYWECVDSPHCMFSCRCMKLLCEHHFQFNVVRARHWLKLVNGKNQSLFVLLCVLWCKPGVLVHWHQISWNRTWVLTISARIIINLVKAHISQEWFFFSSIFISWEFPAPKGQLEWSVRALYHRCQICNQSFAIMDLMMIVGNEWKASFCRASWSSGPVWTSGISSHVSRGDLHGPSGVLARSGDGWGSPPMSWQALPLWVCFRPVIQVNIFYGLMLVCSIAVHHSIHEAGAKGQCVQIGSSFFRS